MKRSISILVAFLALTSVFAFPSSVHAKDDATTSPTAWLQISPVSKRAALDPGQEYDDEFTVQNIGSEEFDFKVSAAPYNVESGTYNLNFSDETTYSQIYRWISFEETEYTLAAGEKQVVKFHISVPEDVAAGGQYATIFAESGGSDSDGGGIKTVSRVGMVLCAKISGEAREEAQVTAYDLPTFYSSFDAPKLKFNSTVKNSGNTDFEAAYHIEVNHLFGGENVYTKDFTYLILPESERNSETIWENTPLLGFFKVAYSITLPGEASRNETKLVIVIPPWLIVIFIALLTIIIVWITITIKKRRQLRSRLKL